MKLTKIFLFFTIITITFASNELTKEEEEKIVNEYFEKYQIRAGRSSEAQKWRENVIKNYKFVEENNRDPKKSIELELNEFSHLSDEEFVATRLGGDVDPWSGEDVQVYNETRGSRAALPTYFNWADRGIVQPAQDQGQCGSCYAFASIAAIESSMCKTYSRCIKLSEQEAMECTRGCQGGNAGMIYSYSNTKGGCATSASYPYYGRVLRSCNTGRARVSGSRVMQVLVPTSSNVDTIRTMLYNNGPMYISFMVYSNFQFWNGRGIYTGISGSQMGGHAVLLTGWGTENGINYWIIKNSWGRGWGDNGYFRIRRGSNLATIETRGIAFPKV